MKTTNSTTNPNSNGYRAEDIIAKYGTLAAFMAARGPKEPMKMPDFDFTEEENRLMDQILAEENAAADNC